MKQIRAVGIPQAELPFELRVSVTLESTGWALWQREWRERYTPRILVLALEGINNLLCPYRVYRAPQVEPLSKEQHIKVRTSLPIKGGLKMRCVHPSVPWLKPVWATQQTYLQQRRTRSTSPPSLEVWELEGPVENIDPPNAPSLLLWRTLWHGEREWREFQPMPL